MLHHNRIASKRWYKILCEKTLCNNELQLIKLFATRAKSKPLLWTSFIVVDNYNKLNVFHYGRYRHVWCEPQMKYLLVITKKHGNVFSCIIQFFFANLFDIMILKQNWHMRPKINYSEWLDARTTVHKVEWNNNNN